jgi:hypothetical protein
MVTEEWPAPLGAPDRFFSCGRNSARNVPRVISSRARAGARAGSYNPGAGGPDGIHYDVHGNLWAMLGIGGIIEYDPRGAILGYVPLPNGDAAGTNFAFGADNQYIYMALPRPRGKLFRKYVALFVAVVCVALIANGAFEIGFSYQEHKTSLVRIQREQAEAAAAKLGQFIKEIESQVGWTTKLPWSAGPIEQLRPTRRSS